MTDCSTCVHHIPIGGNYHIGCNKPTSEPERKTWQGSGCYPLNFDPNTIISCRGYSEDEEDIIPRKDDPILDLVRILMG